MLFVGYRSRLLSAILVFRWMWYYGHVTAFAAKQGEFLPAAPSMCVENLARRQLVPKKEGAFCLRLSVMSRDSSSSFLRPSKVFYPTVRTTEFRAVRSDSSPLFPPKQPTTTLSAIR